MKRLSLFIIVMVFVITACGCAPLLLTIGAAGTAAVSMDTIRLERNVEYDKAWNATITALQAQNAEITSQDQEQGIIQATLQQSKITIKIAQIKSRPTAIDITSRRKGIPDLKTADSLSEQINNQLRQKI